MGSRPSLVVFTDLDGTLLDRRTYSPRGAEEGLEALKARGVLLVLCSAKTRAEQEFHRKTLGLDTPFIVENGGAVCIPEGCFPFPVPGATPRGNYRVVELGWPYARVRGLLEEARREAGVRARGYGDMSPEEVARETGLDPEAARRAMEREYDETVKFEGTPEEMERLRRALEKRGLRWVHGGTFYHASGPHDKGMAAALLTDLYRRALGEVRTVGIGDGRNDEPLLRAVDEPLLVQREDGSWADLALPRLRRVEGVGPAGWARAIQEVLR